MTGAGPAWALFTVAATLLGGLLGLRLRARLPGVMAFTGGVLLGVALFDLGPEAVDRLGAAAGRTVGVAMGAGFLGFLMLSRLLVLHHHDDPDRAFDRRSVGALQALALSVHSLFDGFGIGAGFAISPHVGAFLLIAVVGHDFADGINAVVFVLSQGGEVSRARRWLVIDAVAPEIGALAGATVPLTSHAYSVALAIFAGVFLMIGTSELLPAAHRASSVPRLALTAAGALLILLITGLLPA
ncbi:MAG: ZIP family metal transporter [Mycobacterium sp.]|uniref:ZIP family metal transporter n=1 Tax=Mycobacterium sp. TaxID=1785 RepID=UPI00262DDAC7|nr:ZIP family metal transporter [Mycobacterium sp.]MDI3313734.1 ZIP family metal transporter [Mycobacterium sp.]